jgi:hypothetical protein
MSGESGAVVGRRGRAEIERLAGLYQTSGMGRSEFCRSHGMALSTLNRYLKKQQNRQRPAGTYTQSAEDPFLGYDRSVGVREKA